MSEERRKIDPDIINHMQMKQDSEQTDVNTSDDTILSDNFKYDFTDMLQYTVMCWMERHDEKFNIKDVRSVHVPRTIFRNLLNAYNYYPLFTPLVTINMEYLGPYIKWQPFCIHVNNGMDDALYKKAINAASPWPVYWNDARSYWGGVLHGR